MAKHMTIAVIIPTYNERENVPDLVEMLLRLPYPLHLIIVDDNSPDGTGELAEAIAAREERL